MTKKYTIAIVGGGISGVSLAHFAAQHSHKSIILEKRDKLGGCIETYYSAKKLDFWLELGAHTIYNSYQYFIQMYQNNNLSLQPQMRENHPFKLLNRDDKIANILTTLNIIRAGVGFPLFKLSKTRDRTVADYFSFIFGSNNYQKTLRYCFDAVLCQESQDFPSDFLFKVRPKDKSLPRSFTFKNGLSSIFEKLINPYIDISLDSQVFNIKKLGNHWHIKTNHDDILADKLIFATPWHITQKFLAQIHDPIAKIEYSPGISNLTTIALIFDKDKLKHIKPVSGIIGVEQNFFSIVTRDTISHEKYRSMTIHFKGKRESHEQLINEFLYKLEIPKNAIIDIHHKYNSVPKYHPKHQKFLTNLNAQLAKDITLGLTGNYFTRLAIEDCAKRSYFEVKRLFA